MIEVYDDFFDDDTQQEIYSKLMRPNWGISGNNPGKLEIFWHYEGLENEEYFSEYLYKKICNKLDTEFKGFERIYANGQTAGQCGTPHYDDGDLTFLYYPSPVWDTNWQGHLMFMDENDEVVRVVEHKANRAVLFPGTIKHYADAPHRWFNGLRISLAYKLWKE
mgnify:FL=1|tara:strand:- start:34 stop:525 length:492 start_codon:yes stop_codon:yes gene_type:complete